MRPPAEPGTPTDLVASLAAVAELDRLSPYGDDRLVVFADVPAGLSDEHLVVGSGSRDEDGSGTYFLAVNDDRSDAPDDDVNLTIAVSTIAGNGDPQLAESGREATIIGSHQVWIGADTDADCTSDERVLSPIVATWVDRGLVFDISMYPIPGCDPRSPLDVDDVLALVAELMVCSGWADGNLACSGYIGEPGA